MSFVDRIANAFKPTKNQYVIGDDISDSGVTGPGTPGKPSDFLDNCGDCGNEVDYMKPMKEKHKLKEARLYDAIDKCSTARMAVKREVSDMCPGGIQLFDCPGGIRYERKDEKYKEMYQYIDELFGWGPIEKSQPAWVKLFTKHKRVGGGVVGRPVFGVFEGDEGSFDKNYITNIELVSSNKYSVVQEYNSEGQFTIANTYITENSHKKGKEDISDDIIYWIDEPKGDGRDYKGSGVMTALWKQICLSHNIVDTANYFMANKMSPSLFIQLATDMLDMKDSRTKKKIKSLIEKMKGVKATGRTVVSPFIKDIKTPTLNYKDVQIMEQLIFTDEAISVGFGIPLDMLMIKSKVGTESKIIVDRQDYYESIVPDNKVYLNGFLNEITKKFKTQLKFPELADIYVGCDPRTYVDQERLQREFEHEIIDKETYLAHTRKSM